MSREPEHPSADRLPMPEHSGVVVAVDSITVAGAASESVASKAGDYTGLPV
ncbi:hypothetical protein J2T57_000350 [Natronocella acetinitrilica]|uniref:Uncharacterized protein n=1 Tax=Natronocella acetinitrilica TaxID=414046 RepID=A0AAE3G2I9_9GAMM|nr:hypothetical protein [Natronocella acetinitrilica]